METTAPNVKQVRHVAHIQALNNVCKAAKALQDAAYVLYALRQEIAADNALYAPTVSAELEGFTTKAEQIEHEASILADIISSASTSNSLTKG